MSADTPPIIIKHLGLTNFSDTCDQMQAFTAARTADTADEIWLTEHSPVYSLGLNRKNVRLPIRDDIPVVHCDRGGKITYHGPGQVVMYVMLDLTRYGLNIRQLVSMLESAVIMTLSQHGVSAEAKKDAPGVYVNEAKIASLGLRMKKHYCYHGLSLNLNMDLSPFSAIDPCGYAGLAVSQMVDLGIDQSFEAVSNQLVNLFSAQLCSHQSP
jgi:lipoyl(octanoyl) transferase